jgi:rhodanese-related sulfurtransferase
MVGTVGRTDLLGPEQAKGLAHEQYHSLHERLMRLPDELAVYPTHGAGSFCSAPGRDERTTTIGRERTRNPLLQLTDEEPFVDALLAGFGSFPTYFRVLPEVNRRGPRVYGHVPGLARLDLDAFRALVFNGAQLVDARSVARYAAGHIPGALSIELRPVFATWLGWLVDASLPVVFVLDDEQDRHELVRQCLTVGVELLAGELGGGYEAWADAGLPTASTELVLPTSIDGVLVDVRQRDEYVAGHVPGARNVELGDLEAARDLPSGHLTVMCGHGERAMTGASLLERAGRSGVAVMVGGPEDWKAATGHDLAVGE